MCAIHKRIKERRIELGLTLKEVAEYIGVKEATAQRYESGAIKNISYETVISLAEVLNCTPNYLMGFNDKVLRTDNARRLARMSMIDTRLLDYMDMLINLPKEKQELIFNLIAELSPAKKPQDSE